MKQKPGSPQEEERYQTHTSTQMNCPMIIAMKGCPSTAKSMLALSIAEKLRCPFMDHEDLVPALQQCFPTSLEVEDLINLSYEAVWRMTQAQLRLKLSVIINSPLSDQLHFDRLVELAASSGATLVLIDCRSQEESEPPAWYGGSSSDYDVGDVTKLILDLTTTTTDDVMQFITSPSGLAMDSNQTSDPTNTNGEKEEESKQKEGEEEKETNSEADQMQLKDFAHDHTLVFSDDQEQNNHDGVSCDACLEPISGPIYSCVECQFFLHKSCAELPRKTQSPLYNQNFNLYLKMDTSRNYDGSCSACGDALKNCFYQYSLVEELPNLRTISQTVFLHPKCTKLPSILERQFCQHKLYLDFPHPLQLIVPPNCTACGNSGFTFCYSCFECSLLKLHVKCALLPITIKHNCHCDTLTLTPSPPIPSLDGTNEYCCDVCETRRKPYHWIYYCSDCDYAAHLSCITTEVKPYDEI